jgi:hypothetical protein
MLAHQLLTILKWSGGAPLLYDSLGLLPSAEWVSAAGIRIWIVFGVAPPLLLPRETGPTRLREWGRMMASRSDQERAQRTPRPLAFIQ